MERNAPSREEALELLRKYNKNENLIRHGLAVEGVMRHFAALYNEDADKWGIIGLVHDIDYGMFPEQHCIKARELLAESNWPEEYIRAVQSHGWGICSDVEPLSVMEKVLYTVDELTGLIVAAALVRPNKSIMEVEVKSIKKKWNQKAFAAGVDRATIERGAEMLGLDLDRVIEETIAGMQKVAGEIGLKGTA